MLATACIDTTVNLIFHLHREYLQQRYMKHDFTKWNLLYPKVAQ
jgi:hypothetical protein